MKTGVERNRAALIAVNQVHVGAAVANVVKWSDASPRDLADYNNNQHDMSTEPCIFIIDDDYAVRDGLGLILEISGFACQVFESAEHFLQAYSPDMLGCLLLDVNLPGLSGLELQEELIRRNSHLPIIFLTAHNDTFVKVRAIKAGAADFLIKPVLSNLLIERIQAVL